MNYFVLQLLDEKDVKPSVPTPPSSLPVNSCYTNWRSLDNALHADAEDEDEEPSNLVPKCTSLIPLSPEEEKIILMESAGEDLRRYTKSF